MRGVDRHADRAVVALMAVLLGAAAAMGQEAGRQAKTARTRSTSSLKQLIGEMPSAGTNTATVITSDRLAVHYADGVAIFEGSVVVTDPQLTMKARKLTVVFDAQNQIESLRAIGDVRFSQPTMGRQGRSDVVLYVAAKSQLTLVSNAVLEKGRNQVRGDRITFVLDKETVLVEPAELVIFPAGEGEGEGTRAP